MDKNPDKRFFLSGSSNFELMKGIVESLPGRAGVYELLPMSFDELTESLKEKDTDQLMFGGFYPAIWAGKNKASLFYPSFESSLKSLTSWIGTPVKEKAVIYNGDFQNEAGVVKVVNFRSMNHLLPEIENE
ncbi:MAG: AAA family ATPase [Bacteroidales bacterium]|nr:AAA family ATPase [Bacteroidales bacterium]